MSIIVHPLSKWTAAKFVKLITKHPRILLASEYRKNGFATHFKSVPSNLSANGAVNIAFPLHLVHKNKQAWEVLTNKILPWYQFVAGASKSNHWFLTTATLGINRKTGGYEIRIDAEPKIRVREPLQGPKSSEKKPQPLTSKPRKLDLTKDDPGKPRAADPLIVPNKHLKGPNVEKYTDGSFARLHRRGNSIPVKSGTVGVCLPSKSYAAKSGPFYDDRRRGVIAILTSQDSKATDEEAAILRKYRRGTLVDTILHELIHAGLWDKHPNKLIGHCHEAFFALDRHFKVSATNARDACCDQLEKRSGGQVWRKKLRCGEMRTKSTLGASKQPKSTGS